MFLAQRAPPGTGTSYKMQEPPPRRRRFFFFFSFPTLVLPWLSPGGEAVDLPISEAGADPKYLGSTSIIKGPPGKLFPTGDQNNRS